MASDVQTSLESPQVEARALLAYVGGFVIFVGTSLVLLRAFFVDQVAGGPGPRPQPALQPRLETHNGQTLAAVRRNDNEEASSYAWIDRANGRVRIPVARAMQIIAARGSSAYDPLPQPEAAKAPQ